MTIFGFNTDVKNGDTVYHVQSEARQSEKVIQTLVFVKGQCIGKRTGSYVHKAAQPDFDEQSVHELLKAQHKTVLDAIHEGKLNSVLGSNGDVHEIGESGAFANVSRSNSDLTLEFQVTFSGEIVSGAEVVSRAGRSANAAILARATTDAQGNVKMRIPMTNQLLQESEITVEATHGGRSVTRRFKIKMPRQ